MSQTVTKVTSMLDWEGIYIDGTLEYQNHTANISDIDIDEKTSIGDIQKEEVNMSKLGISELPTTLKDLRHKVNFCETVVENKDVWIQKIKNAVNSFNYPPNRDELINELDIMEEKFDVIEGCFMPEGVFNNNTALGDVAVLAKVEKDGQLTSKYTLMQTDNAKSYE